MVSPGYVTGLNHHTHCASGVPPNVDLDMLPLLCLCSALKPSVIIQQPYNRDTERPVVTINVTQAFGSYSLQIV